MTCLRWIGSATTLAVLTVALLAAGASAATGTKARIALDQRDGVAGGTVTGHGAGFDHWATDGVRRPPLELPPFVWTNADYVQIHWNALGGAVVWEGAPDDWGDIRFQFTVPADATPGDYTIVATQTGYDGRPTGGTPTRATLRVLPAASPPAEVVPAASPRVAVQSGAAERPAVPPRDRARPTRSSTPVTPGAPTGAPAGEGPAPAVRAPALGPAIASRAPAALAPARAVSRSAGALAQLTRTRHEAPAAQPPPAVRAAAPAPAVSGDGVVAWQIVALAALLVALAATAAAYAIPRRASPARVPPPVAPPLPPAPTAAPDPLERELRELLAQYDDDRVPELAGQR